jgi:hypothetical protein
MSTALATLLLIAPVSTHRIVFRRRQKAALFVAAISSAVLLILDIASASGRRSSAARSRPSSDCSRGTRSRWPSGAPAAG